MNKNKRNYLLYVQPLNFLISGSLDFKMFTLVNTFSIFNQNKVVSVRVEKIYFNNNRFLDPE